jgi:hypothetical protein
MTLVELTGPSLESSWSTTLYWSPLHWILPGVFLLALDWSLEPTKKLTVGGDRFLKSLFIYQAQFSVLPRVNTWRLLRFADMWEPHLGVQFRTYLTFTSPRLKFCVIRTKRIKWMCNGEVDICPPIRTFVCIIFDIARRASLRFSTGGVGVRGSIQIFRTSRVERELQMVQLSGTNCSCITILWVSLVSFTAITLCIASQWVFIVVYFSTQSGNFWIRSLTLKCIGWNLYWRVQV